MRFYTCFNSLLLVAICMWLPACLSQKTSSRVTTRSSSSTLKAISSSTFSSKSQIQTTSSKSKTSSHLSSSISKSSLSSRSSSSSSYESRLSSSSTLSTLRLSSSSSKSTRKPSSTSSHSTLSKQTSSSTRTSVSSKPLSSTSKLTLISSTSLHSATKPTTASSSRSSGTKISSSSSKSSSKSSTSLSSPRASTLSTSSHTVVNSVSSILSKSTSSNLSSVKTTLATSTTAQSASSTSFSVSTSTATNCPNYWSYANADIIYLNTTDSGQAYGFYGQQDVYGLTTGIWSMGWWSNYTVNSFPDIIYDIGTVGKIQAIFPNGTSITTDSTTRTIAYSDCINQTTLFLGNGKTASKRVLRGFRDELAPTLVKDDNLLIQLPIAVQTYNACMRHGREIPDIWCYDTTPGEYLAAYPKPATIRSISPGTVTASCNFIPSKYSLATSASCYIVYPIIDAICTIDNAFYDGAGSIPLIEFCGRLRHPVAVAACLIGTTVTAVFCAATKLVTGSDSGSLKDAFCGWTSDTTKLSISIGNPYQKDSTTIAEVWSNNPEPVMYIKTAVAPADDFTCTPCEGYSQYLKTPWTTVYSGSLIQSGESSRRCGGGGAMPYYGSIPAGSLGDAQAQCLAIAEKYNALSYWVDDEKFYDDQGNMVYEGFGCWVEGCTLTAADFTVDVETPANGKLSEEVIAFSRTVQTLSCY